MKIIKSVKQSFFCAVILSFLFTSCSEQRYTYYNIDKKNTAKLTLDKPADINSATESFETFSENKDMPAEPIAEISINKETEGSVNKATKKRGIVKNVTKAIDQTLTAPSIMLTKVPAKINDVFASNSNTMDFKEDDEGHSLLWTIIVVILILWLLGFLVGNVGALIHLLLVIALILIILTLLSK